MGIMKHGDGWRVQVRLGALGCDGTCSKVVRGTFHDALIVEAELRLELLSSSRTRTTFKEIAENYIEYLTKFKRPSSAPAHIKKMIVRYGKLEAEKMGEEEVLNYISWRKNTETVYGKKLSVHTIVTETRTMKAIFSFAHRCRRIRENPIKYFHVPNNFEPREIVYPDDGFINFLKGCSPRHALILFCARFTGLRYHHIFSMEVERIVDGVLLPPIFDKDRLWRSSKKHGLVPVPDSMRSIFPDKGLVHLFRGNRVKDCHRWWQENKEEGYRFHDLRRTYSTWLREMDIPLEVRMMCMGHAIPRQLEGHMRYQGEMLKGIKMVNERIESNGFYQRCLNVMKEKKDAKICVSDNE